MAGAEVGHLDCQQRSREPLRGPEQEGEVVRRGPGQVWRVKQQRAASFQLGLPCGCLQSACRKEGKAVAGIQCRLREPKFRSDTQGDARKSTHNFLSLSLCNALPYRGTSSYIVY